MWQPLADLEPINQDIVLLERHLLALFRRKTTLTALLEDGVLQRVWTWVDAYPAQAVLMARIKSSHAMTPRHGLNVMLIARAWAVARHRLGKRIDEFSLAALVHDWGHWLTESLVYVFEHYSHEQMDDLKSHPELPADIDELLTEDQRRWISEHHEQPNAKGYPHGNTDTHVLSRLLRVVDVFEGLTTARRIRPRYSEHAAMTLMKRWAGLSLDAGLFRSFERFMGAYPAGTYVDTDEGLAVSLPPEEAGSPFLLLTSESGDVLDQPVWQQPGNLTIRGEAPSWREQPLRGEWANLRPDQVGLPRMYG